MTFRPPSPGTVLVLPRLIRFSRDGGTRGVVSNLVCGDMANAVAVISQVGVVTACTCGAIVFLSLFAIASPAYAQKLSLSPGRCVCKRWVLRVLAPARQWHG